MTKKHFRAVMMMMNMGPQTSEYSLGYWSYIANSKDMTLWVDSLLWPGSRDEAVLAI